MSDIEYQNLLAPALAMNEREAAKYYCNLSEQWYALQNNKAFKAFSKHLQHIIKLLVSTDKKTQGHALCALAFIAASPLLHPQLFKYNVLQQMIDILKSCPDPAACEAILVVLNHLFTPSSCDNNNKSSLVTGFCNNKQSLMIVFRYAHVADRFESIIAKVMLLFATLCTQRPNIQENCVRAGMVQRAFNLKTSNRNTKVRSNVNRFLTAMQLEKYSVKTFNKMHSLMCTNMGFSSRALCLAIWRLMITNRCRDALKFNTLYTVVQQISTQDPLLDKDWNIIARFADINQQKAQNDRKHKPAKDNNIHKTPNKVRNDIKNQYLDDDDKAEAKSPPPYRRHVDTPCFERNIHIAILQTNPIESDGSHLAVYAEQKRLQEIFFKTERGLKIFFGVLTKDSLIRCIQRGAQIIHISGHGPNERKLMVEDKHGRLQDISTDNIKEAIVQGGNDLKLVFVSTCYSQYVAQSFCDVGVPHVVAVHSMVQIKDEMAIKFADAFYAALITHKQTVETAFNNSKAELLLEKEMDCCCRHEGHIAECLCPNCKKYRCCSHHHGVTSLCKKKSISCCQPNIPHRHCDKFLILPKDKGNKYIHNERILSDLPNARCERMDTRPPTNIRPSNKKIVGRGRDTKILIDFLHPDNEIAHDAVIIHGRPKVGLSSLALEVGRFFTRSWYQAMFSGGVFRINLQNCNDPNALYAHIAQVMNLKNVFGCYSYWDPKEKRYIKYDDAIQKELNHALRSDDITDPIEIYPGHYIVLEQHKKQKQLLQYTLPPKIYVEFEKRKNISLPMEFYIEPLENKVCIRVIKFSPPDPEEVLSNINRFGNEFEKLFIIDHINFEKPKMKQFLQKIKRLIESVKCKLLLLCHDGMERTMYDIQQKMWRIKPISRKDAAELLLDLSRELYSFDYHGLRMPSTTAQFPIFDWLCKSPALIHQCATVLNRKVPFCVILKMMNQSQDQWRNALDGWSGPLRLQPDELKDALDALYRLLTQINQVRAIWFDGIRSQKIQTIHKIQTM